MPENLTISELDDRIAVVQDNIRELIEQAAALSRTADEARTADPIAQQSSDLEELLERRDALRN